MGTPSDHFENLRVHFYGVQGSGSIFPTSREMDAWQEAMEYQLLKLVFADVSSHAEADGRLDCTVEEIIGGPLKQATLRSYRQRFQVHKPRVYGGWTTCVRVETADGYDLVFDCGSGFRNCAKDLQDKWISASSRDLWVFGSHSHTDHTEGFDQAAVCFDPRNTLHIHGNYQYLYALDSYLGILSRFLPHADAGVRTPINYAIMPAKFKGVELVRNATALAPPTDGMERVYHDIAKPVVLGETTVTAFEVYHPAPCLAFKIERGGKKFIFCTNHELRHGDDPAEPKQKTSLEAEERLAEHAMDADLLYRDGQFLRSEYEGITGIGSSNPIPRIDWGHSCLEDVQEMVARCRVKRTLVGHHDPNRELEERRWIDESLTRSSQDLPEQVELACAGTVVDL